jgi:uncharacterized protein
MPNAFAHIELTTDNLSQAGKFYQKVFDWKLQSMPKMNYTMIDVGDGTGGGMQGKPMPSAPTGWLPYVAVDDVKKTIVKAVKAGASIVLDYHEIGDMGAIAIFTDPGGCSLGIWAAAAAPKKGAKKTAKKVAKKVAPPAAPAKKTAKKAAPPSAPVKKKAPAKGKKKR